MTRRVWWKLAVAVLAGAAGIVTVLVPTWFEALFEESPDNGSGSLEALVGVALIVLAVGLCVLAIRDLRAVRAIRAR